MFYVCVERYGYFIAAVKISKMFIMHRFAQKFS